MARRGSGLEEKQGWMRERQSDAEPPPPDPIYGGNVTVFETHYRPKDLAKLWCLDESTVRRLFQDERPGDRLGEFTVLLSVPGRADDRAAVTNPLSRGGKPIQGAKERAKGASTSND